MSDDYLTDIQHLWEEILVTAILEERILLDCRYPVERLVRLIFPPRSGGN